MSRSEAFDDLGGQVYDLATKRGEKVDRSRPDPVDGQSVASPYEEYQATGEHYRADPAVVTASLTEARAAIDAVRDRLGLPKKVRR